MNVIKNLRSNRTCPSVGGEWSAFVLVRVLFLLGGTPFVRVLSTRSTKLYARASLPPQPQRKKRSGCHRRGHVGRERERCVSPTVTLAVSTGRPARGATCRPVHRRRTWPVGADVDAAVLSGSGHSTRSLARGPGPASRAAWRRAARTYGVGSSFRYGQMQRQAQGHEMRGL